MAKSVMPRSRAKTAYGLLSEIRKLIIKEPRRYDQFNWTWLGEELPRLRRPSCGTVCCVAGWVSTLKFKRQISQVDSFGMEDSLIFQRAKRVLGLDSRSANQLFSPSAAGDQDQQTVEEHARRGAEHIARFQQKYAKQLRSKRV